MNAPSPQHNATDDVSTEAVVGRSARSGTGGKPSGVLAGLEQRKRERRRRTRAPGWVLWIQRQGIRSRYFLKVYIPHWFRAHREELASLVLTFVLHIIAFALMALWVLPPETTEALFSLVVTRQEPDDEELIQVIELAEIVQPESLNDLDATSTLKQMLSDMSDGLTSDQINSPEDRDFAMDLEPTDAQMESIYKQGEFGGRSQAGRQAALKKFGGTAESEKAVSSGLKWLQSIQREDGSWSFASQGPGAKAGRLRRSEVGATSLALLCFLGSGHTHTSDGPYRDNVERGLRFIGQNAKIVQGSADLRGDSEGNSGMYIQGLATICLSEAHALERHDSDLEKLTTMAVTFIERAQNLTDGGWRYRPRDDAGDMSVVGWQLMALYSAKAGRIRVDSSSLRRARDFLRDVQTEKDGSRYAYMPGQRDRPSMTAVGLLCRMYLGWRRDNEGLQKGVKHLAAVGPSRKDPYYNYYATQVMHHFGGDEWKAWNSVLREHLVSTQIKEGPAAGSWRPTDHHGDSGGQLYQTALSLMTLEAYYRHLPLYRDFADDPDAEPLADR